MMQVVQRTLFEIVQETHQLLNEFEGLAKRTVDVAMKIGDNLIEIRDRTPHGDFLPLLNSEFGLSQATGYNFIHISESKDKFTLNVNLPLYIRTALASPKMPQAVIDMVETGRIPATLPAIREAKQEIVDYDRSQVGYKYEDRRFTLQEYTPPDATSQSVHVPFIPPTTTVLEHPTLNTLTSKSNEWYTPQRYIDAARELMGGIDLDPASNPIANETVKAANFYDSTSNGLDKDWTGRVWLNPPYGRDEAGSNQDIWSHRLIDQYEAGITTDAILLVNAAVDTKWFQRLFDYPICFPDHRINFYSPDNSVSGSTHGSALVYFGLQSGRFREIFSEFGTVVRKW